MLQNLTKIREAALLIAYDNGIMARFKTQEEFLGQLEEVLGADGVYQKDLNNLEMFLSSLTKEDFLNLIVGDDTEKKAVEAKAPLTDEGVPTTKIFEDLAEIRQPKSDRDETKKTRRLTDEEVNRAEQHVELMKKLTFMYLKGFHEDEATQNLAAAAMTIVHAYTLHMLDATFQEDSKKIEMSEKLYEMVRDYYEKS